MPFIDLMTNLGNRKTRMTWEQAVEWLRQQPGRQQLVRDCYYDDPLLGAAERFFQSDEWEAVQALLPRQAGRALDLGAGRGIGSYALVKDGWEVTALEPDPSSLVGAGAIRRLVDESGCPMTIVTEYGERLPFGDGMFDVVYSRQVLHHAKDLSMLCAEAFRVLRRGGRFIATREHVIDGEQDLKHFLDSHPLHHLYGGENAYTLEAYVSAVERSGFTLHAVWGPFDSVINYFPMSKEEWLTWCRTPLARCCGKWIARLVACEVRPMGSWILRHLAMQRSRNDHTPGRLFTFVADKKPLS